MSNDLKILCIIPARAGSKGVPKKNIKLINNKPLISYSLEVAQESKLINKIIVTSDSKDIVDLVNKDIVYAPFIRPSEFSQDNSTDKDYIKHTLKYLKDKEGYVPNYIVLLRPTTPLRNYTLVDEAINKFIDATSASSLRSAHLVPESPFKWFKIKNDCFEPICNEFSLEDTNKPRQYFDDVYLPNGYVDVLNSTFSDADLYGTDILSYITPLSYEIDSIEDFDYIEYLMKKAT
ncbi:MAG: acylneuraminate cytidylyltransferase family protein [Campylobacteraceae bacterium]|nr:acylneuraminate cytidylyltransferase family protein [Campylobacteraceae bacterium]